MEEICRHERLWEPHRAWGDGRLHGAKGFRVENHTCAGLGMGEMLTGKSNRDSMKIFKVWVKIGDFIVSMTWIHTLVSRYYANYCNYMISFAPEITRCSWSRDYDLQLIKEEPVTQRSKAPYQVHTAGKSGGDRIQTLVHLTPALLCLPTMQCCLPSKPCFSALALQFQREVSFVTTGHQSSKCGLLMSIVKNRAIRFLFLCF